MANEMRQHGPLIGALLLLVTLIFTTAVQVTIESEQRQQARYNLEQIESCLVGVTRYDVDINVAFDVCTKYSRTTSTGDVYVLDGNTREFIFENSRDVEEGLFYTEESVGQYFSDWGSAVGAEKFLFSGKDSKNSYHTSYNFDGSTEWLEWSNYLVGNEWYVIVQGVQKDEALDEFEHIMYGVYGVVFVIALGLIALERREQNICHLAQSR